MISMLILAISLSADPTTIRTTADLQSQVAHRNNQLSTLSWHCEFQKGILENGRFVPGNEFSVSDVITQPSTGRCRLHIQSVKRGTGEIAFYGERRILAFDGKQARYYVRQQPSDAIPVAQPLEGIEDGSRPDMAIIRPDINPANLDGERSGLAFVLGNTFNGALDYLLNQARSKRETSIAVERLQQGAVYRLRIENEKTYSLYDYDTDRMCFVNFEMHQKGADKTLIRKADIEFTQVDGVWLPAKVITRTPYDNFAQQLIYSNWKVNEPIPDSRFAFSFPKGTRVEDHVEKKIYIVGGAPADEAKAIRDYMSSFHIEEPERTSTIRNWLIAFGLVLLGAGMIFIFKKRRGLAVLLLVVMGTRASAENPGEHRLECGFQVTVAVLEYYRVRYDPAAVSKELMADSRGGISLAKVKSILDSHGMETSPRNGLSREQARRTVQSGWLAIVPAEAKSTCTRLESGATAGKPNHYFLLWNSPLEGAMVVDILRRPTPLAKSDLKDSAFADNNSAILFIRRRSP